MNDDDSMMRARFILACLKASVYMYIICVYSIFHFPNFKVTEVKFHLGLVGKLTRF